MGPPGSWVPPVPYPPRPQQPGKRNARSARGKGGGKGSGKGGDSKRGSGNKAGFEMALMGNGTKSTHNVAGTQLCYAWGRSAQGCTTPCPNQRAHQCEFCLGPHRTIDPNCMSRPAGWTPPAPKK
jgi:hypothetical protein